MYFKLAKKGRIVQSSAKGEDMKTQKIILLLIVFGIYLGYYACKAAEYYVVDGDSLEYGAERIRLYGIDAPEYLQECRSLTGEKYPCGQKSKEFLQTLINDNISCKKYGKDRYGRSLKECFASDGTSINREMVINGWAVSFNDKFQKEEELAQKRQKGIWQGKFMRPELYRALNRNRQKNFKR